MARPWPLHTRILVGMGLGLAAGLAAHLAAPALDGALAVPAAFVGRLVDLVGELFLRALRFVAVPIVLFSLVAGTASLDDVRQLGRIGGRTVAIYLFTTSLAISIGLGLADLVRPGTRVPDALRDRLAASGAAHAGDKLAAASAPDAWRTLAELLPTNPFAALAEGRMLQVVVLSVLLGIALTLIPRERARPVLEAVRGLEAAVLALVHLVMRTAPVAVFCLVARVVADLGLDVLGALLAYTLTVLAGLAAMVLVVYPAALRLFARVSPRRFFRAILPAQLLAFSSSSSSATLPVTMECVEERLGVRRDVTSFVIPLGATVNMDGTALYQGVATLFIAQLYGIHLGLGAQLGIVLTATLASIGTAGVPGVGIVMLVIVLQAAGLPPEAMKGGIAIIFGIDRLLDMCRTVANVTGDCMVAAVVGRAEGALAEPGAPRP